MLAGRSGRTGGFPGCLSGLALHDGLDSAVIIALLTCVEGFDSRTEAFHPSFPLELALLPLLPLLPKGGDAGIPFGK